MGDLIGKSVKRVEDNRFLKGEGKYTDDFNMQHQTFAVYVRSPHAHANLVSVDISAAKAMAGVLRALADGDITPNEASSVAGVIETYRKTLETAEFEGRLKSLEQVSQNSKS